MCSSLICFSISTTISMAKTSGEKVMEMCGEKQGRRKSDGDVPGKCMCHSCTPQGRRRGKHRAGEKVMGDVPGKRMCHSCTPTCMVSCILFCCILLIHILCSAASCSAMHMHGVMRFHMTICILILLLGTCCYIKNFKNGCTSFHYL